MIRLASGDLGSWTEAGDIVLSGGGDLEFSTPYNEYVVSGKVLFWQFRIVQTTAGTGTDDITIDPPSGVSLDTSIALRTVGHATGLDLLNNNTQSTTGVIQDDSGKIKIYAPTTAFLFLRGGNFIGNNNTCSVACNLVCRLA